MNQTVKTSISLQKNIWQLLSKYRNRSSVINEALDLYFQRKEMLKQADKEYWENVERSLKGENSDYISLNSNGEELDEELLNQKLWS